MPQIALKEEGARLASGARRLRGEVRCLGKSDYLSSGPEALVGLDELVQDLLGDLGGRDGGGERQRLPQLLVGALDQAWTTSFSTETCCSSMPFCHRGTLPWQIFS